MEDHTKVHYDTIIAAYLTSSRVFNNGTSLKELSKEMLKLNERLPEVQLEDFIYAHKSGYTVQVKDDKFLNDYFCEHGSYASKYTSLWAARAAIEFGLAVVVIKKERDIEWYKLEEEKEDQ